MTDVFKIMHNIYDPEVSPELRYYPKSNTNHMLHYESTIYEIILSVPYS